MLTWKPLPAAAYDYALFHRASSGAESMNAVRALAEAHTIVGYLPGSAFFGSKSAP